MTSLPAPHDTDAEQALLGAMLLTSTAIHDAIDTGLTSADYYNPNHAHIHEAIIRLHHRGIPADIVTVHAELNGHGDQIGGKPFLAQLQAQTPTSYSSRHYARIVHEHAQRRRLAALLHTARDTVLEGHDPTHLLDQLTHHLPGHDTTSLRIPDLAAITNGTIQEEPPTILTRLDNQALLYPGRLCCIYGEPSVGKTWIAYAAGAETLRNGGSLLVLDWEDSATNFVIRMRALGVADPTIADPTRVVYINPELGLRQTADRQHLVDIIEQLPEPVMVIVDAYGPALARDGIEENSNTDVLAWTDQALSPLTRAGALVLILDHVSKDPATRTRGGRGAGAKLALITGAAYEVRTIQAFSRTRPGRLKLVIAKDRLGHVGPVGANAGEVVITPDDDRIHIDIEPPADRDQPFRPTHLMEKVSRYVEDADEPVSARTITSAVPGKNEPIREAIRLLATEGFLTESGQTGRGGGVTYTSKIPFREDETNRAQPRPNRAPGADQSNRAPAPPHNEVRGHGARFELFDPTPTGPTAPLDHDWFYDPDEIPPFDPTDEPPE